MTKRKPKTIPKGLQSIPTTPRKGSKSKQRRVQPNESALPNDAPDALKQKKLDFAPTTPPEANDPDAQPPVITPFEDPKSPNRPTSLDTSFDPPPKDAQSGPSGNKTPDKLRHCRYKITIEMLPTDDPLPAFCAGFKKTFEIIQKLCKPNPIWLAAWDPEQSSSFDPIKEPREFPSGKKWTHRRLLSAYFGGYIDPNPKGEKIFSKVRFDS